MKTNGNGFGPEINIAINDTTTEHVIYENGIYIVKAKFLTWNNDEVTSIQIIVENETIEVKKVTYCIGKNQLEIHGVNGSPSGYSTNIKGFELNETKVLVATYADNETMKKCVKYQKQPNVKKGRILTGVS